MNIAFASDIHGSATAFRQLMQQIEVLAADRLVLLGDILYHGPRNDLPRGYAPKELIGLLNNLAPLITCVRGNCDAEVDQMVLDFPITSEYALIEASGRTFYLTHGHRPGQTESNLPALPAHAVFASGHTHVKRLESAACANGNAVVMLNPGSISIPKDGVASFAFFDGDELSLHALDGSVLKTLRI